MIKSLVMMGAFAFAATSNAALAQQGGQQPPARGPQMALALEAAQTSVSTCTANGSKVSAAIVDSAGVLRVLLSADGAGAQSVDNSTKKAFSANALKASTSEVAEKMKTDQALAAKLNAVPTSVFGPVAGCASTRQSCSTSRRRYVYRLARPGIVARAPRPQLLHETAGGRN
jgi:uncharacterized protein GlcG (DUF336 family)